MAARRRRAIIEDDGGAGGAGEAETPPPPHAPTPETVAQLEGREARSQRQPEIRLSRKNPRTQSYGLIFRGPPELVTPTWVQENIGGGEYKSELYGIRSDGKFGFLEKGQEMFEVDESIPFRGAPTAVAVPVTTPVATPAPAGAVNMESIMNMGFMQMLNQMNSTAQMQVQMMKDSSAMTAAAIERMNTPRDNGMKDIITALAPILGPIMAALVAKKDPTEIAAELVKLSGPKGDMTSSFAMMREMMETVEFMRGGDGGSDPGNKWFTLAEKTLPGVIDLVKAEAAKRGVTPMEVARGPSRAQAIVAATPPERAPFASPTLPPQPVPVPTDEWTPLEGAIQQLHGFAGRDPRHIAGMALALATDVQKAELKDKLERENITEQIVARFPEFGTVRSWLEDVVYELQVELDIIDPNDDRTVVEETPAT